MFRLFEKYTPFQYLCKYYSKSFHSLDIAMYSIYYATESSAFPSNLHPMYSLSIKVK